MGRQKGQTGRAPILNSQDFEAVMEQARAQACPARDRAILGVSFYLGLRAKEIAALKVGDVFGADGTVGTVLHIKPAYAKKNRMRDVYVASERLRSLLASYRLCHPWAAPDSPLFPTRSGRHFTANGMAHLFRRIYADAGLQGASSHSGRRTLITGLAEQGVDLKAIATLAGHASISTTCIYVENNPARLARTMAEFQL